ncbi:MAG: hypothetical protein ACRDJU_06140 [Actinomycetota bacterium]
MSDHEDQLRRHLHDPRWELPVAEDAEDRIRRAARRDHRVRIASALALVLMLGTAATGYGLSRQSKSLHVITPAGSPSGSLAATPSEVTSPTARRSPQAAAVVGAPAGFEPASVTFVSADDGWVLGAPCPTCTVAILHTADGGKTWGAIPAPPAPLSEARDANSGVSTIRFADANDGWLFGPDLWATHDGGATWQEPSVPGLAASGASVADLEAANGIATAAILEAGSIGIDTTPASQDAWHASPTTIQMGAGPVPEAQIVLHGASGWILENDRTVLGGARLVNGAWQPWTPPCEGTGGPASLAASTASSLDALCDEGIWSGSTSGEYLYRSTDGGTTFAGPGTKVPFENLGALAVAPGAPTLLASGYVANAEVLVASFDGGSWATVYQGEPGASELNDLGFTTASQGVAVPGIGGPLGTLLMTHDGGHSWAPVSFAPGPVPVPPAAGTTSTAPTVKPSPSQPSVPQPSPTLPASGAPTIGSPGWPASTYAPSVPSTAGTALSACPSSTGLEAFSAATEAAAGDIAKGYGQAPELSAFEYTDPSFWSTVVQSWSSGHQSSGPLAALQSGPASQSSYSTVVAASCGSALLQMSYEVTVGPPASPGANACVACDSQLFFIDRYGTPLLYFTY